MKTISFLTVIIALLALNTSRAGEIIKTNIIIDTLGNEIELEFANNSQPIAYVSHVLTPVCLDGTCYPIRINIYWNLAGEYLKYTVDTTEILTKIDHIPFTKEDYIMLDLVIRDAESALANFTIDELTANTEEKVDGVTGATRSELEGAFVPGALYTSHTLWHLVRNPSQAMRKYSKTHFFTHEYQSFILNHKELGLQYYYLADLISKVDQTIDVLAPIIDSTDNELAIYSIQLIDSSELNLSLTTTSLAKKYENTLNSDVKLAILSRWFNRQLTSTEQVALINELGNTYAAFQSELDILQFQSTWDEQVYFDFHSKIKSTNNMMRREKMKKVLFMREAEFPKKIKKRVKQDGI